MEDILRLLSQVALSRVALSDANNAADPDDYPTSPTANTAAPKVTKRVIYLSMPWPWNQKSIERKLSAKECKALDRFEEYFLECLVRSSICRTKLQDYSPQWDVDVYTSLRPNSRTRRKLKCLLRQDDESKNPYLKWSRRDLLVALFQRRVALDSPDTTSRFQCRVALEHADMNCSLRFMDLPKEMRMLVYEQALLHGGTINQVSTVQPALFHVSQQVRKESQQAFFSINRFRLHTRHYLQPRRKGHLLVSRPTLEIHPEDLTWLQNIGSENVARLRRLIIATESSEFGFTRELQLDLSCSDVTTWSFPASCDCDDCQRKPQRTLAEMHALFLFIAKRDVNDPRKSAVDRIHSVMRFKQDKERLEAAQKRMDTFNKQCGKGKGVKATIEGLRLLAGAVCKALQANR